MASTQKIRIVFVTKSPYKKEENEIFAAHCLMADGTPIHELFEFDIRAVPIQEILHVDLKLMVVAEAMSAYSQLKVPCIVEHAGLIFVDYCSESYPGGLTKPMWENNCAGCHCLLRRDDRSDLCRRTQWDDSGRPSR